jgi:hypothetical protein
MLRRRTDGPGAAGIHEACCDCEGAHLSTLPAPLQAWVEARKESNFAKFAPYLQEWVDVRREAVRGVWASTRRDGC